MSLLTVTLKEGTVIPVLDSDSEEENLQIIKAFSNIDRGRMQRDRTG